MSPVRVARDHEEHTTGFQLDKLNATHVREDLLCF